MKKLLYSFLFSCVLLTSANAEFNLHSTKAGIFIINTNNGEIFKLNKLQEPVSVTNVLHLEAFTPVIFAAVGKDKELQPLRSAASAKQFLDQQ